MGDVVGHCADTTHQALDPVERCVDVGAQAGVLVATAGVRDAGTEVASANGSKGVVDSAQAAQRQVGEQPRCGERNEQHEHQSVVACGAELSQHRCAFIEPQA